MIKRSIQQQTITTLSTREPSSGVPNYISQTLLHHREEIYFYRILVGGFNIHFRQWTDCLDKMLVKRQESKAVPQNIRT